MTRIALVFAVVASISGCKDGNFGMNAGIGEQTVIRTGNSKGPGDVFVGWSR